MIDAHCHIDLYDQPMHVVRESERLGIVTLGMTNLPSHFKMGYQHLRGFKKTRLALGMHPLMAEYHEKEFDLFFKCLDQTSYIGEVGLDFSGEASHTRTQQIRSFERILQAVQHKSKLLSIHSRRAEKEVLDLLIKYRIKNAIFHWYSGGLNLIDTICSNGYYFSINTAMIKSKNGKKIVARIPKEFILTETDGPFITEKNKVVEPRDVIRVVEYLSDLYQEPIQNVVRIINQNFKKIISELGYLPSL